VEAFLERNPKSLTALVFASSRISSFRGKVSDKLTLGLYRETPMIFWRLRGELSIILEKESLDEKNCPATWWNPITRDYKIKKKGMRGSGFTQLGKESTSRGLFICQGILLVRSMRAELGALQQPKAHQVLRKRKLEVQ